MSGIMFDPNGVSLDISFKTNEFERLLNLLQTCDSLDNNIYNKLEGILHKAKEQNDRNIHIVVTEPVEYDY